jgi:predicted nucleic acid-binding protein
VTQPRRIVLDANILLRGVLGNGVRALLQAYESDVSFYSADVCFEDARAYIPSVAKRRQLDVAVILAVLDQLEKIVEVEDRSLYEAHESVARKRMASRDIEDWPIMAAAMLLDCPIWTEDQDFFGSGVATWTTANVELYLRST